MITTVQKKIRIKKIEIKKVIKWRKKFTLAVLNGTSFSKKGGRALKRDPMPSSDTILDNTSPIFFP
tara:strand:+ start:72 stop:269 length:198 start_codon:yes stop_codon:yes gene_type:complete